MSVPFLPRPSSSFFKYPLCSVSLPTHSSMSSSSYPHAFIPCHLSIHPSSLDAFYLLSVYFLGICPMASLVVDPAGPALLDVGERSSESAASPPQEVRVLEGNTGVCTASRTLIWSRRRSPGGGIMQTVPCKWTEAEQAKCLQLESRGQGLACTAAGGRTGPWLGWPHNSRQQGHPELTRQVRGQHLIRTILGLDRKCLGS